MKRLKKKEQKTQLEQNFRLTLVRLRRSKKKIGRSIKDYGEKFFLNFVNLTSH
jgi:hypothetical protein